MKTKTALTAAATIVAALVSQTSFAQASSPMATPAGQAPLPAGDKSSGYMGKQAPGMSTESSSEVKAKTKTAAKHHKLVPAGEANNGVGDHTSVSGMKKSHAGVKANTKNAIKDGSIPPAGEGPGATLK